MSQKADRLPKRENEKKNEEEEEEEVEEIDSDEDIEDEEDDEEEEGREYSEEVEGDEVEDGSDDEDDEDLSDDEEYDDLDCESEELIDITKAERGKRGDEQDDDEESSSASALQVDMEFKDASPSMFHSVKFIINNYLDSEAYSSSVLADAITAQAQLGTFIVIDEEEDDDKKKIREMAKLELETNTIGFCTILNGTNPAVAEVMRFFKEKFEAHSKPADKAKLVSVMKNPSKVGVLINERIINVAPQAVPMLHQQILEDFAWVKENSKDEFKAKYDVDFLICIAKCAYEPQAELQKLPKDPQLGRKQLKKNEQENEAEEEHDLEDFLYPKFEDFLLLEKSVAKCIFEAQHNKQSIDPVKTKQITYKALFIIRLSDYLKTVPDFIHHVQA